MAQQLPVGPGIPAGAQLEKAAVGHNFWANTASFSLDRRVVPAPRGLQQLAPKRHHPQPLQHLPWFNMVKRGLVTFCDSK